MSITQGLREYDQNIQLRNLCERLAVDIPREGERAFYFPQGHLEQQNFSTKQEFSPGITHFNLPSQILCKVINIQLLVEPTTREICFRITLIPDRSDPTVPDPTPSDIQNSEVVDSFYRKSTASVTSTPEVSAGQDNPIPSSVTSGQYMYLGVLATASYAVMTGTLFTVYYKQRASKFVIRLNKYLEAVNNNIDVGMRFKMRFQREDSVEMSFFGTIIGMRDFSPHWPDSKWRTLKVHWNEPANIGRPERVSLWQIEPIMASGVRKFSDPISVKSKRFKPGHIPSRNSNSTSRMRVDVIRPASPLLNESSSFLSKPGKDKAGLNDSSNFLSESEKDIASTTSALASFCNWFCCCFK